MLKKYIAFVDESGGHGFDFTKDGTSEFFVVSVVITDSTVIDKLESDFTEIKKKYFPISEMKSSSIGSNESRRREIIVDINNLIFGFYSLIVDKRKIDPQTGLRWKPSFYKFLYGIMYNNLNKTFSDLSIVADEMIGSEFMDGFKKYVQKNHTQDLFRQSINFNKSKNVILLQLADFIGGTINRHCSGKSNIDLLQELKAKDLGSIKWPEKYESFTVDEDDVEDNLKEKITDITLLRVNSYLKENRLSEDSLVKDRIKFLEYLKSLFLYNSKNRFIPTHEIINHLEANNHVSIKEDYVRRQIVAPLRDKGVLIASNNVGYKLPYCQRDLIEFFNMYNSRIQPMLSRIKICNDALRLSTNNSFNVLDKKEYMQLKRMIENI